MPLHPLLAGLRRRLSGRPDSEHEQAIVRLLVGATFFLYFLPQAFGGGALHGEAQTSLFAAMVCFMTLAAGVFAWICVAPAASPPRRIVGSFLDLGATTFFMYYLGEYGAPLYIVYLWTIFGNGIRYGKAYLHNSLALSFAGFGLVVWFNEYWAQNRILGVG